ncbi:MAG TPA: hypothetical protein DIC58_11905, partial [Gammaproteobacteria bacterium]|nr:hypothetical protein [Gammaproteobacteria bacterium]
MKKYLRLLPLLVSALTLQAQDTILLEDFEDATLTYTANTTEFSAASGTDFFGRIPPLSVSSGYSVTGFNGDAYFGMMDMNVSGVSLPVTLTFSSIDISGYSDLNFSILLAEDDDGSKQDWDAADYARIEYQIDGGGYQNLLAIEADISSGSNGEPAIDTNFDGVGHGTKITSTFAEFTAAIAGTGSSLDIRISASFQSGDEDLSIDDVKITGTGSGGGGDPVSEEAITLGATPATVDEGSTLAVTLSVPTNVDTDTVFNLTSGGDGSELSIPATATILAGTNSVNFDV